MEFILSRDKEFTGVRPRQRTDDGIEEIVLYPLQGVGIYKRRGEPIPLVWRNLGFRSGRHNAGVGPVLQVGGNETPGLWGKLAYNPDLPYQKTILEEEASKSLETLNSVHFVLLDKVIRMDDAYHIFMIMPQVTSNVTDFFLERSRAGDTETDLTEFWKLITSQLMAINTILWTHFDKTGFDSKADNIGLDIFPNGTYDCISYPSLNLKLKCSYKGISVIVRLIDQFNEIHTRVSKPDPLNFFGGRHHYEFYTDDTEAYQIEKQLEPSRSLVDINLSDNFFVVGNAITFQNVYLPSIPWPRPGVDATNILRYITSEIHSRIYNKVRDVFDKYVNAYGNVAEGAPEVLYNIAEELKTFDKYGFSRPIDKYQMKEKLITTWEAEDSVCQECHDILLKVQGLEPFERICNTNEILYIEDFDGTIAQYKTDLEEVSHGGHLERVNKLIKDHKININNLDVDGLWTNIDVAYSACRYYRDRLIKYTQWDAGSQRIVARPDLVFPDPVDTFKKQWALLGTLIDSCDREYSSVKG
jgi:hypothetical protein